TLTNVTFALNYASYDGGGLNNATGSTATLNHTTFSGNYAGAYGGGIRNDGTLTLTNSIVAGNAAYDSNPETLNAGTSTYSGGNIIGTKVYAGSNHVGDTQLTDVFNSIGYSSNTGAYYGQLRDNGGAVPTIALKPIALNPAIDAADPGMLST